MGPAIKEEIKLLRANLEELNLKNQKLDLEIRVERAIRWVNEKEAELERLRDPNESTWPDSLECCSSCVNY